MPLIPRDAAQSQSTIIRMVFTLVAAVRGQSPPDDLVVVRKDGSMFALCLLLLIASVIVENSWHQPTLNAENERKMQSGECTLSAGLNVTCAAIDYGTEVVYAVAGGASTTSTPASFAGVGVNGMQSAGQCTLRNEAWGYGVRRSCNDEACTQALCRSWLVAHGPPTTPCCHNLDDAACHVIPASLEYRVSRTTYTAASRGAFCVATSPYQPLAALRALFVVVYVVGSLVAALSCFLCSGAFQRRVLGEKDAPDMDCCLHTLNRRLGGRARGESARPSAEPPNYPEMQMGRV